MGNYLKNVAHRSVGTPLLRPRVASRFEPAAGMGPAMSQFREVVTEREVEAPRVRQVTEARVQPASRVTETRPRREESQVEKPAAHKQAAALDLPVAKERIIEPSGIEAPIRKSQKETRRDPAEPPVPKVRFESPEVIAETRVPSVREVIHETLRPRVESEKTIIRPATVKQESTSEVPQIPAPKPERAARRPEVTKLAPQIRYQQPPQPSPASLYAEFDQPRAESSAPSVHVTIGKVTVQATMPAAHVPAPVRAAAPAMPRLTLETYLNRRGGRP